IPFGLHEQRGDSDLGGIVIRFSGSPVVLAVLNHAVWCADIGRVCLRTFGIGRPSRIRPGVEPSGRNEGSLLVVRHAGHPALHCLLACDLAIAAKRTRSGLHKRRRLPDPSARVQYEALTLAGVPAALRQAGGAEVMALGINGATSESARLTELPLAGVCHGFRELLRRLGC